MHDAVAEATMRVGGQCAGVHEGRRYGGWNAGSVVLDEELETPGDDAEGDADLARRVGGFAGFVALLFADGLDRVADEIDGDAFHCLYGQVKWRQNGWSMDRDRCRAGGDALQHRRQVAQDGGVVEAGGLGCLRDAAWLPPEGGGERHWMLGCVSRPVRRWDGRGVVLSRGDWHGQGMGEKPADEVRAARRDQAQLGRIVAMLGAEYSGNTEQIAVEAEGSKQIAGVMG